MAPWSTSGKKSQVSLNIRLKVYEADQLADWQDMAIGKIWQDDGISD